MNLKLSNILLLTFLFGAALTPLSAAVIPISDSAAFQKAIDSAPDGSIIELAAGTYAAPSGGFTLFNPTAGFTVRNATGAIVVFNGAGSTDILRYTNSQKPITFQGITFANGVSTTNFIGG